MEISAKVIDQPVQAMLQRLQGRISNMSQPMGQIGAFYERSVQENFQDEAAPDGKPWAKLSQTTLLMGLRKKKGWKQPGGLSVKGKGYLQGKKILRTSGDLAGSVHFQATRTSVAIGSNGSVPYAAAHQIGVPKGYKKMRVTIPAREWLALNTGTGLELAEKDRKMILEILQAHLAEDN